MLYYLNMNTLTDNDVIEYGKMISILSNRMISDRETAQDAAQEVWVEVVKSLPSFCGESKLSTWIYTIAKRVICRHLMHERHHSTAFLHGFLDGEGRELPSSLADFDKELWIKEECDRCLTGLFHCLGDDAQMTYIFRDVIGLPYAEIARIMGYSEQDARKSVSRSRKKLRNFLNRECRIFNPCSECKCRMNMLIESIDLPSEYQRIRDLAERISIFRQAEKVLPTKNYWEKYFHMGK
ncbi:MAG: RNA polymerase sigma factor [Clostridiales bacterium]|nr:RNA polymerase sigma factor [Clostridiales bacterium]